MFDVETARALARERMTERLAEADRERLARLARSAARSADGPPAAGPEPRHRLDGTTTATDHAGHALPPLGPPGAAAPTRGRRRAVAGLP
ncbi:MAG TPA: hypothetical protein VNO86_02645, partial [Candidatus Binatia bacterium]|nr:hypothetical protein [Candidatus Binatia bacterium]